MGLYPEAYLVEQGYYSRDEPVGDWHIDYSNNSCIQIHSTTDAMYYHNYISNLNFGRYGHGYFRYSCRRPYCDPENTSYYIEALGILDDGIVDARYTYKEYMPKLDCFIVFTNPPGIISHFMGSFLLLPLFMRTCFVTLIQTLELGLLGSNNWGVFCHVQIFTIIAHHFV